MEFERIYFCVLTAAVHGTDMEGMIAHSILDIIEELRYLLVRFLGHAIENLFDEMLLVSSTGLDDQFAGRSALCESIY